VGSITNKERTMLTDSVQRWIGFGLGAAAVTAVTLSVTQRSLAQRAGSEKKTEVAQRPQPPQPGDPRQPGIPGQPGVFPGQPGVFPGQPGFQGQPPGGQPGGRFQGGFPPFMGGGSAMTATPTTVYVLRGNEIFAFDATTLKVKAHADIPMPEFGPAGPGGRPGVGRPGAPSTPEDERRPGS
jgi:hypothetical protein